MNGPWHRRKLSHTTHLRDISSSVRILRERHPFEGRALPVMGTVKRRGVLLLLAVLPDGSRSLIPASWTDWKAVGITDERSNSGTEHRKACLAPLPVGFVWGEEDGKVLFHPDEAVCATIRSVFSRFTELGSARRVWL